MQKAIELIKKLLKEHEEFGFCTNTLDAAQHLEYDVAIGSEKFYDAGRYETLENLLSDLEKIKG